VQEKSGLADVVPVMIRFTVYTLVIFAVAASLPLVIHHGDIALFREGGLVEWLQVGLLVGACGVFLAGAWKIARFRDLFLVLAAVAALAVFREMDTLLDKLIPWLGWKIGTVTIPLAGALVYAHRHQVGWQMAQFLASPAFAVLWAGFIVAVPVAQLLGHGPLLELLMGDDYKRGYKRVVEESGEFVGYLLLVAGSVETLLSMKAAQARRLAHPVHARPADAAG
jgi:hypothetical protein